MAVLTTNTVSSSAATTVTVDTLTASDTLTLDGTMLLFLSNNTGGSLSPVLTGDGSTSVTVQGVGVIDASVGTDVFGAIADGAEKMLKLNVKAEYLKGTVTITSGTGLEARLIKV